MESELIPGEEVLLEARCHLVGVTTFTSAWGRTFLTNRRIIWEQMRPYRLLSTFYSGPHRLDLLLEDIDKLQSEGSNVWGSVIRIWAHRRWYSLRLSKGWTNFGSHRLVEEWRSKIEELLAEEKSGQDALVTEEVVYHITSRADWDGAQMVSSYRPPSLAAQGFVHCSTRDQVLDTANRFYRGQDGLVLLCIDASRLAAPLRYEPPDMPGHSAVAAATLFPHLYGPLNIDAVTQVVALPVQADGAFVLPPELGEGARGTSQE